MSYTCYLPTRVLFGAGKINELHKQTLPGKKALLLIPNENYTKTNGSLEKIENELELVGIDYVIFDKIIPNPSKDIVRIGANFAKDNNCDFIIALGGGSVMDAGKAISLMATNEGDLWDYISFGTGKNKPIKNSPLPIVTITTTAGTGSEVDCCGVIINSQTNEKIAVVDESLHPVLAIVDPELMTTIPPNFTAYQGFDALFHFTEGYIAKYDNMMGEMFQRSAIENIGKYLARAVKNGNDIEAREHIAFVSTLAGYSTFFNFCTSEHALEHPMSAYHQNLPHGAGLIMISKAYYKFFIENHACDDKFIDMAKMLGKSDAKQPMDFIIALENLQKDCGVDNLKMSDYGISVDEFEMLAQNAMESMERLFQVDPIAMTKNDCIEIYRASFK